MITMSHGSSSRATASYGVCLTTQAWQTTHLPCCAPFWLHPTSCDGTQTISTPSLTKASGCHWAGPGRGVLSTSAAPCRYLSRTTLTWTQCATRVSSPSFSRYRLVGSFSLLQTSSSVVTSLTSGASAAHMQWPTSRSRWSPVECYSFASYSLQVMHSLQAASAPLRSRVARVLISFNGNMDRRSQALSALRKSGLADDVQEVVAKRASSSPHVLKPSRVARYDLWWAYTQYAFVAAPPSHGQDTYRFWEVLTLGSIPLVPSGPLDSFYARFPCVILRSWDSITPELLDSQMAVLLQRIRNGSFDRRLMHSGYYADRIRDAQPI